MIKNSPVEEKSKVNCPKSILLAFVNCSLKIQKNMGFHLDLKTADLQAILHTTRSDNFSLEPNTLCLYVLVFVPDPETQSIFNE